jgi:hypothetical protein
MNESSKPLYVGRCAQGLDRRRLRAGGPRRRGAVAGGDRDPAVRHRQADPEAPVEGCAAGVRLRGRAVRLLAVSVPHRKRPCLPRGGAVADPAEGGGTG